MKFRIYQPFFDQSHLAGLDREFEHVDHMDNPAPTLREHPINLKCYDRAVAEGLDVWGMFSWKWRQKLPSLTAQAVIDYVADNPDYDIYFFNPFTEQEVYCYNVWEQGQWCHPAILEICEELFPAIGLDPELLYQPMACDTMCWANYYMGNKTFWDEWLALIDRYIKKLPQLSPRVQALHESGANYGPFPDLNYFAFIHERLFSTYLLANKHRFRIKAYHHGWQNLGKDANIMRNLKLQAIEHHSKSMLEEWNRLRTPLVGGRNWGAEWVAKY